MLSILVGFLVFSSFFLCLSFTHTASICVFRFSLYINTYICAYTLMVEHEDWWGCRKVGFYHLWYTSLCGLVVLFFPVAAPAIDAPTFYFIYLFFCFHLYWRITLAYCGFLVMILFPSENRIWVLLVPQERHGTVLLFTVHTFWWGCID